MRKSETKTADLGPVTVLRLQMQEGRKRQRQREETGRGDRETGRETDTARRSRRAVPESELGFSRGRGATPGSRCCFPETSMIF